MILISISEYLKDLGTTDMAEIKETVTKIRDNLIRKVDEIISKSENVAKKCRMLRLEVEEMLLEMQKLEQEEAKRISGQGTYDGELRHPDIYLEFLDDKKREFHIQVGIMHSLRNEITEYKRIYRELVKQCEKIQKTN